MLNNVTIMGRLTADPELKHTTSDIPVARFSIAVDRDYTKAGEEKKTDFINIVAWRNTAEFVSKYFSKGQLIAIQGSIQTGSYTTAEGENRRTFEVLAERVYFTGESKKTSTGQNTASVGQYTNHSALDIVVDEAEEDLPF